MLKTILAFGILGLAGPCFAQKKQVLIVTYAQGYKHESIANAEIALKQVAKEDRRFEVSFCRTAPQVKAMMSPSALKRYDAVVFANTTGELGTPDMDHFLRWIRGGKAFIGMHSATATGQEGDPRYHEMVGALFKVHGNQADGILHIDRPTHPAAAGLKSGQKLFEEYYHFTDPAHLIRKRATVLASLKVQPLDALGGAGKPKDMPMAWVRRYGQGRVFYTALGHQTWIWDSAWYRQHIKGGIQWALNLPPR